MPRLKFDDCRECAFKRKPYICRDCDYGELFESAEYAELSFTEEDMFRRTTKSLVSEDEEPDFNPDDLVHRIDDEEKDQEDEYDEPEDPEEY